MRSSGQGRATPHRARQALGGGSSAQLPDAGRSRFLPGRTLELGQRPHRPRYPTGTRSGSECPQRHRTRSARCGAERTSSWLSRPRADRLDPAGAQPLVSPSTGSRLAATTLAEYVRLESCERYLWNRLHAKETELFRTDRVTERAMNAAPEPEGRTSRGADHRGATRRRAGGRRPHGEGRRGDDRAALARRRRKARTPPGPRRGTIGAFEGAGFADLVVVEPGEDGSRVTVGDAKAKSAMPSIGSRSRSTRG